MTPDSRNSADLLFPALAETWQLHGPTDTYSLLQEISARDIAPLFASPEPIGHPLGPFGALTFPFHSMGAVTSLHLFGLDELILFAFYWHNRSVYRNVADIGANLGLHSVILSRCGYSVRAFEPDPTHLELLRRNLELNACDVDVVDAAVSSRAGVAEFIRVLGNTTGSHLAGAKPDPYGELERFEVRLEPAAPIFAWADLVKIDAEGHEVEILRGLTRADWAGTDVVMEVGSPDNAADLYALLTDLTLTAYSQKRGWRPIHGIDDMPSSYREGSLFISGSGRTPWGG